MKGMAVLRVDDGLDMNKLERRFLDEVITPAVLTKAVVQWGYESWKFRLGKRCWYTPDFWELRDDGSVWISEVKGVWRDDARVKWRAAAERYPMFEWCAWTKDRKAGWKIEQA